MPIQTHIAVNAAKFDPKNENEQTQKLNAHLESIFENNPRWWEVLLRITCPWSKLKHHLRHL